LSRLILEAILFLTILIVTRKEEEDHKLKEVVRDRSEVVEGGNIEIKIPSFES
jgi:hypothetical protein